MRPNELKRDWLEGDAADIVPLYRRGPAENAPRPAYIELNLETEDVTTVVGDPSGAVPSQVRNGLVRWVEIDPRVIGSALEEFLHSEEVQALARRVFEGAHIRWNGSNRVGEIDEDAAEALEELEALAAELPTAEVWTPERWLGPAWSVDASGVVYIGDKPVTEETFEELPEVVVDGQTVHVIPGLHAYLEAIARENTAARKRAEAEEDMNPQKLQYGGVEVELWHDDAGKFNRFTLFFSDTVTVDVAANAAAAFGLIIKEPSWLRRYGVEIFAVDEWPVRAPAWPWGRTPHQSQEWRVFVRKAPFEGPSEFDGRTTVLE